LCLGFSVIFVSCEKKDGDTIAPQITIDEPIDDEVLILGADVHFEADFLDDVELKSYKIDIHDNFNGHSHKSLQTKVPWTYQKSWTFDTGLKNAHIHHHEILVPEMVDGDSIQPGHYHFMVYCTDAAGNESWTARDVEIVAASDTLPAVQ
jgi:hypothetical protein